MLEREKEREINVGFALKLVFFLSESCFCTFLWFTINCLLRDVITSLSNINYFTKYHRIYVFYQMHKLFYVFVFLLSFFFLHFHVAIHNKQKTFVSFYSQFTLFLLLLILLDNNVSLCLSAQSDVWEAVVLWVSVTVTNSVHFTLCLKCI